MREGCNTWYMVAGLDIGYNGVNVSFLWQTYMHSATFVYPTPCVPKKLIIWTEVSKQFG